MKAMLAQLVNCSSNGEQVGALQRFGDMNLPAKTSFRLADILDAADKHLKRFNKCRLDLYKKHGTHKEEDDTFNLETPEQVGAFQEEYKELLATEIELPGAPFKLSDLYASASLRPNDLRALAWMIDRGTKQIDDEEEVPEMKEVPEVAGSTASVVSQDDEEDLLDLGQSEESNAASA